MRLGDIKGVLFDAFGTLCRIESPQLPYRSLMKRWAKGTADCYQAIMTRDSSLAEFGHEAGLSEEEISNLETKLSEEIRSMRLFPEVERTLQKLRALGLKIGIVSNLAKPYGPPLLELLPFQPEAASLSYEVGSRKPEEAIYRHAWEKLGCAPHELLMVGDSLPNDYEAPVKLGLQTLWLRREQALAGSGNEPVVESVEGILSHLGIH